MRIDGEIGDSRTLTTSDFGAIDSKWQVPDVSQVDPKHKGKAVRLAGVLELVAAKPTAKWLTLHSSRDNFHASIPLDAVRDGAIVIYELDGQPLPVSAGGPFRFLIRDFAACHTAEVDECANVKFVDRIELTAERGFDNRPQDDAEHAKLHEH